MKQIKKIAAGVTALAIAVSATGCTIGSNTSYVLSKDDTKVSAGVYLYYAYSAYSQAVSYLSGQDEDLDTSDVKALKALTIDGKSTETWIKDRAIELCQEYVAIENEFDELGLELSSEDSDTIDSYTESYISYYGDAFKEAGVSEESIKAVLTSSFKSSDIFDYYYAVGGEKGIEESEYYDYYTENNARVRMITFNKTDGSGEALTDTDKTDFEDMVDDYYEAVKSCKTVEEQESKMDEVESEYDAYVEKLEEEATAETDEDGNIIETETESETEEDTTEDTSVEDTTEDTSEDTSEDVSDDTATEDSSEDVSEDATDDTSEEDTSEDEDSEDETTVDEDETDEETTTTSPYENETVISKYTTTTDIEGNTPDEDDITYSPAKSVQLALFDEDDDNYVDNNNLILINDDESEYLILRLDITERMTDDDLWTDDAITTVSTIVYNDEYMDTLEGLASQTGAKENKSAVKRYDVFKINLYGQD
jgi:hypothetical protein